MLRLTVAEDVGGLMLLGLRMAYVLLSCAALTNAEAYWVAAAAQPWCDDCAASMEQILIFTINIPFD